MFHYFILPQCGSASYLNFKAVDLTLIFIFLSIPLIWAVLLWRSREKLNPDSKDLGYVKYVRENENEVSLLPIRFLFTVYKPGHFMWEPIEM